ncbi:unnamed protein product [Zymoseptoria tritici ST99CH_1A5]|uniref:F-box domain-containing protein n=2 Tax=Zymoseptoria tritici TaxID=1047171 RepID=A0A2H1GZW6_ZYMTR|nr:unnamed protein product [Zymoseptoria tritici ST99CH_1E4]SMY28290.1 unnamed protein product [Zymoseptoria tritici ST99CH_1A5]
MSSSSPIDLTSSPLGGRASPRGRVSPTGRTSPTPMPLPKATPPPKAMPPSSATAASNVTPAMPPPSSMPAMPPPSITTTFSQRKVQAVKDHVMLQLTDSETDDLIKTLQNRQRKDRATGTSNQNCGLLLLPPEILNLIYEEVATDAHAKVTTHELKDAEGKKVRPGLLGTCYQIYKEFFSVFWSSSYIRCEFMTEPGVWMVIREPKLLHAIVHQLHRILVFDPCSGDPAARAARIEARLDKKSTVPAVGYDDSNNYFGTREGFLTLPCLDKIGKWCEVSLMVQNPDSDVYRTIYGSRSGSHVNLQGFTLQLLEDEKLRII